MASHNDSVDRLRIASPCPSNWEQMNGDDRVRFCEMCNLHVYNISQMTRKETAALIASTEGRLCARLFRRSDGTIITKDCPVGLRAIRRRMAKVAGAVFATIVSVTASIVGQKPTRKDKSSCQHQVTVTKSSSESTQEPGSISGTVVDQNGELVPGVRIKVGRNNGETLTTSQTDGKGQFLVRGLKSDTYELTFESKGFDFLKVVDVKLGVKDSVTVAAILTLKGTVVTVGIIADDSLLSTPLGTTIFSGDLIRRLPH